MLQRDPAIGWLRINTRPASQVFIDGELVGDTPQMSIPLSFGRHSVTLVNTGLAVREALSVTIVGPLPHLETRCLDLVQPSLAAQ